MGAEAAELVFALMESGHGRTHHPSVYDRDHDSLPVTLELATRTDGEPWPLTSWGLAKALSTALPSPVWLRAGCVNRL